MNGRLKITKEHQAKIETLMNPIMRNTLHIQTKADFEAQRDALTARNAHKINDRNVAFRWNVFHMIPNEQRTSLFNELYEYANDDHIDRALKCYMETFCKKLA